MKYLRVEMKICEGCGAIWLRCGMDDGVYCASCAVLLAEFPPSAGKRPGGRPRRQPRCRTLSRCSVNRRSGGAQ
jgi:hypothetical protein